MTIKMQKAMKNNILFSEKQQFRSIWAFLPFLIVAIGLGIATSQMTEAGKSLLPLLFAWLVALAILFFFVLMRLETVITNTEIYVRFYPFLKKQITWTEVEQTFIRAYQPLWEYGGWGIRLSPTHGKAYNVAGNKGLQLILKNGEKILIGTQKEGELEAVINKIKKQNTHYE